MCLSEHGLMPKSQHNVHYGSVLLPLDPPSTLNRKPVCSTPDSCLLMESRSPQVDYRSLIHGIFNVIQASPV